MTTHDDKARERARFEEIAEPFFDITKYESGGYIQPRTSAAWCVYQQGREDERAALSPASTGQEALAAMLDADNLRLRGTMQKLMARLADLLDEDQFAECETLVCSVGVDPGVLRAAPAQQVEAEKWISVTERLPEEEDGTVIITDGKHVGAGDAWEGQFLVDSPWQVDPLGVTHWMRYPAPPAAGSNNGEKGAEDANQT